jgi:hypothetical protein
MFMARVVRIGRYYTGTWDVPRMPQMDKGLAAYETFVGDRLKAFAPNTVGLIRVTRREFLSPFDHKLRHDAEFIFWLLMWWAMFACPEGEPSEITPRVIWYAFAGGHHMFDPWVALLSNLRVGSQLLHSAYRTLEPLIEATFGGDHMYPMTR